MRDPRFFGDGAEVEVRETHLSYVFLTGARAFKLKKPLVLSFVDYGTLERRRQMCEAEVRLNQRLAPSIYLGVRSVVESGGVLSLSAANDPRAVEYLVEMRRFSDDETLAARLEAGMARGRELEQVGRRLSEFHHSAPRAHGRGARATLEQTLLSSLDDLALLVAPEQRQLVAGLRRFAVAYLQGQGALIDHRSALAIDGHGDIRAEHVLLRDPIEVVDCVEFDRHLRELDPARDLAFLLMDLEARGWGGPAMHVLRSYAAAGGDPGPPHLLAFYSFERALVRAKVDLIRAGQLPAGPEAQRVLANSAQLLELARRLTWRAHKPLLVVVCGLSGAGKTHLASAIARVSGLRALNSDVVRKRLAGVPPYQRARDEHYSRDFSRRTYAELANLAGGGNVVVDATFRRAEDRAAFLGSLPPDAPEPHFIHCVAPHEVLRQRVAARTADVSDATIDVLEAQHFDPLEEVDPQRRLELRTDRPVEAELDDVEAWLDAHTVLP
jgi:aminoglycoside phosphotransferase family enzyme/predicted kinase